GSGSRQMTTDPPIAKASTVGAGIHKAPGYAARRFGARATAGVNSEMTATSEIRITCMIAEDEVETAVQTLHAAFELARPDDVTDAVDAGGPTASAVAS